MATKATRLFIGASLSGVGLGLITIYVFPASLEILLWALLIASIGFVIAKEFTTRVFRRGFWHAVLSGAFITLTHITFVGDYLNAHPEERELMQRLGLGSSRITLLALGPLYWTVLGMLTGFSSMVWRYFSNNSPAK